MTNSRADRTATDTDEPMSEHRVKEERDLAEKARRGAREHGAGEAVTVPHGVAVPAVTDEDVPTRTPEE